MKKVGIITICDYVNYGNRLQNYASQEVLKSLGCEVQTIVNVPTGVSRIPPLTTKERLIRARKMSPGKLISRINAKIHGHLNRKLIQNLMNEKARTFREFTNKYISETPFAVPKDKKPEELADQFDFFTVGSDQIWNPMFRKGTPHDFLQFAPQHKRIAYAPSFGISEIPGPYVEDYRKWLSGMAHLSVREDAGAAIIQNLTGRKAEVLVDPTLMLTKEKWLQLESPTNITPSKPYILTYYLGELEKDDRKIIENIASKKNLDIKRIASLNNKDLYTADPAQFIRLVCNCEIFFTDSFHGAVFSILMEKPFAMFVRKGKSVGMSSRIDTLLSKFGLESRKWELLKTKNDLFSIDFSHVPEILDAERTKALNYLSIALGIDRQ